MSAAASFTSSWTIIGTWPGCCSDQARTCVRQIFRLTQFALRVDVGLVHHLEARLVHGRVVRDLHAERDRQAGVQELAALRIGPHVQLDRAHAELVELLGQRAVFVLEAGCGRGSAPCRNASTSGYKASL